MKPGDLVKVTLLGVEQLAKLISIEKKYAVVDLNGVFWNVDMNYCKIEKNENKK